MFVCTGRNFASYAVLSNKSLYSWGENSGGQLGDGTLNNRSTVQQVQGLPGIIDIAAGLYHAVALDEYGNLWAWGNNSYGQIGDNTTSNRLTPVAVPNISNVVEIASGNYHNLALTADGKVYSWGSNAYGQIGDGSNTTTYPYKRVPTLVPGLTDVVAIGAGSNNCFALRENGEIWTWGDNQYGKLGDGTTTNRNIPVLSQMTINIPSTAPASPVIDVQPVGGNFMAGQIANLNVMASTPDAGSLSYQWYSNTSESTSGATLISGANMASYSPSTASAGTMYYFVIVTNTITSSTGSQSASTTSNIARIIVLPQPASTAVQYTYDSLGRLKSAAYPSGLLISYNYDTVGNITSVSLSR